MRQLAPRHGARVALAGFREQNLRAGERRFGIAKMALPHVDAAGCGHCPRRYSIASVMHPES